MMDPRIFREAIRTTTVSYPVPFVVGILMLFALLCFCGSFAADGILRWLLAGTALAGALVSFLSWAYALFRRPELLRSERHQEIVRLIDIIGDSEMDQATRTELIDRLLREQPRARHVGTSGDLHE